MKNNSEIADSLLPPATKLRKGHVFTSVCQELCPRGRAVHACPPPHTCPPTTHTPCHTALPRMPPAMHTYHACPLPHTHPLCPPCHACMPPRYYEVWSMSGPYSPYLNAFLLAFVAVCSLSLANDLHCLPDCCSFSE